MKYPANLLSDGETIVKQLRPHWRGMIVPIIVLFATLAGAVFLSSLIDRFSTPLSWVVLAVCLVIFIMYTLRPFLYWLTTQYVFTTRRIIVRTGLIAKHGRDMPLSKVNNVSFDVSFWGRILNYGVLSIDSASGEELIIADVPKVEEVQMKINQLYEEDDERRRGIR